MNIWMRSLGCDKNLVDAERMLGVLDAAGHVLVADEADAEAVIVNTCCFIDPAKEESIAEILHFAALKRAGVLQKLIVTGCMAERYREEVLREIPEVDALLGPNALPEIANLLAGDETCDEKHSILLSGDAAKADRLPRLVATPGRSAYLKIAEGCDKACSYCIIPAIRGPYRSVPMDDLLEEARTLAKDGIRELILVAQETTRYGLDRSGKKELPELLTALSAMDGLAWIRLLYAYPEEVNEELLQVMAGEEKICHALDIPVQHASNRILSAMRRQTNQEELRTRIARMREVMPDIVLRTSLISGFPGETEEDHGELLAFIKEIQFDHLGVFSYSQEEGTPAADLPDQIPEEVKARRVEELMLAQQEISLARNRNKIGKRYRCLVDAYLPDEARYAARTYGDAPDVDGLVFFSSSLELESGDFVDLKITAASPYDLEGEMIDEYTE